MFVNMLVRRANNIPSLQRPCEANSVHEDIRYTAESASWVLIASILVFFMVGEHVHC